MTALCFVWGRITFAGSAAATRAVSGLREQAKALGLQVWVRNSTDQLHNLQIQGPNSRAILKDIIWTRPDQGNGRRATVVSFFDCPHR